MPKKVPSRLILTEAEQANEKNGHENLGFLSEQFGFLPKHPPLLSLPKSHQAWDTIASTLPKLYETVNIRETFANLPILDASEQSLENKYLCRASTLLGIFAHAYYWLEANAPHTIPPSIMQPWQQISTRLNRFRPFLSYTDLVLYNWQFRNQNTKQRCLSNLALLVETVGKKEESIFYLTMVEMAAVSAPIIGSIVRAQEAVMRKSNEDLKKELIQITECIEKVKTAFLQIELNPYSSTYVDPVTWGKCVAVLPVPWETGIKGTSGTAAPYFHLLDTFLGRARFDSIYGQDQMYYRQIHNTLHVQRFLQAVEKISVTDYIINSKDPTLKGIYHQLIETYVSENGLLGTHQRKVYGYLSTAFKTGRFITAGGTSTKNPFVSREWEHVDAGLEKGRTERVKSNLFSNPIAHIKSISFCNQPNSHAEVENVVFDIKNSGIIYKPGDHCGILPENSSDEIDKTLASLQADKDELIRINKVWRDAFKLRPGFSNIPEKVLLSDFLRFAKIRPIIRSVAQALYEVTVSPLLKDIIDSHKEDQWELWDMLNLISFSYDVRRLWKLDPWQKDSISNIVPPEQFRLYSISSSPHLHNDTLELTIAALQYKTETMPGKIVYRSGTASNFIDHFPAKEIKSEKELAIQIFRPTHFNLPTDHNKPIVMFAGGTGIAPFHGFISNRVAQPTCGENWLFYGIRTVRDFYYQDEIEKWIAAGKLNALVKISDEGLDIQYEKKEQGYGFFIEKGQRGFLNSVMEKDENANILWDLLCSEKEGGKGAYFYVCGSGLFFNSIFSSIKTIIARFVGDEKKAAEFIYTLVAENRFMQDIFTTFEPHASARKGYRAYDISEVAVHNNDEAGYWVIINDEVYDVTEFLFLHPGGDAILTEYAGMDATKEYKAVKHHLDSVVETMLSIYKIGSVRKLHFDGIWGIALTDKTLDYVSLEQLYRNWVRYLYVVIEMENMQKREAKFYTQNERSNDSWRFIMQAIAELQHDFLAQCIEVLMGELLQVVWRTTVGLCSPKKSFFMMKENVDAIKKTMEYKSAVQHIARYKDALEELNLSDLRGSGDKLNQYNRKLLVDLKTIFIKGIKLFENNEQIILESFSEELMKLLESIIEIFRSYFRDMAQIFK